MDDWRSMDTAPKNGDPVLLFLDPPLDTNYVVGWAARKTMQIVVGWASDTWRDKTEWHCGFCEEGTADTDGYSSAYMIGVNPVAWMPLPIPPVAQLDRAQGSEP